jgi:hypothetical protein
MMLLNAANRDYILSIAIYYPSSVGVSVIVQKLLLIYAWMVLALGVGWCCLELGEERVGWLGSRFYSLFSNKYSLLPAAICY